MRGLKGERTRAHAPKKACATSSATRPDPTVYVHAMEEVVSESPSRGSEGERRAKEKRTLCG